MARFTFIVPPLTGHINPTLTIGAELLQRGHEVSWISLDPSLKQKLPDKGQLCLISYEDTEDEKKETGEYLDLISKKNVYGIDSIKFLYEEVLIPLNKYMYEGILTWLEKINPDVVITDHQVVAGAIAATKQNIPYATSITAPAAIKVMDELPKVHEWEEKQIVALQQQLGIKGEKCLDCSSTLCLVFTSKDFFGEMDLPSQFKFVGPVTPHRSYSPDFDWKQFHQSDDQPKILVSIGTTFDHKQKQAFFAKVMEAFGNENLTVVLVSDPALFERIPANFIVQKQVPQIALLPYLQAVVSHGGNNTVCETLSFGLPLVVIPIAYDQSHVAGRVVRVGAGLRLNFNRFKAKHLKESVMEILTNPSYTQGAKRMQRSFQEAGGCHKAAGYLEQLIHKTIPETSDSCRKTISTHSF